MGSLIEVCPQCLHCSVQQKSSVALISWTCHYQQLAWAGDPTFFSVQLSIVCHLRQFIELGRLILYSMMHHESIDHVWLITGHRSPIAKNSLTTLRVLRVERWTSNVEHWTSTNTGYCTIPDPYLLISNYRPSAIHGAFGKRVIADSSAPSAGSSEKSTPLACSPVSCIFLYHPPLAP